MTRVMKLIDELEYEKKNKPIYSSQKFSIKKSQRKKSTNDPKAN